MKTLAVLKAESSSGISSVEAFGTMELKQKTPLFTETYKKLDYNINPLKAIINKTLDELIISYYQ